MGGDVLHGAKTSAAVSPTITYPPLGSSTSKSQPNLIPLTFEYYTTYRPKCYVAHQLLSLLHMRTLPYMNKRVNSGIIKTLL